MSSSSQSEINFSWIKSLAHTQVCEFNITVSESNSIEAELAPGDSQVLGTFTDEFSISSLSLSFDDLRSKGYELCERQILISQPDLQSDTVRVLVEEIVGCGMKLVSVHGDDDVNFGYVVEGRLDIVYLRQADEEDLAYCRQFDDMMDEEDGIEDYDRDGYEEDDIEGVEFDEDYDMNGNEDYIEEGVEFDEDEDDEDDDMDDDVNLRFRGVEEGRYDGGDGKQVSTCSVCLEDLSSVPTMILFFSVARLSNVIDYIQRVFSVTICSIRSVVGLSVNYFPHQFKVEREGWSLLGKVCEFDGALTFKKHWMRCCSPPPQEVPWTIPTSTSEKNISSTGTVAEITNYTSRIMPPLTNLAIIQSSIFPKELNAASFEITGSNASQKAQNLIVEMPKGDAGGCNSIWFREEWVPGEIPEGQKQHLQMNM